MVLKHAEKRWWKVWIVNNQLKETSIIHIGISSFMGFEAETINIHTKNLAGAKVYNIYYVSNNFTCMLKMHLLKYSKCVRRV